MDAALNGVRGLLGDGGGQATPQVHQARGRHPRPQQPQQHLNGSNYRAHQLGPLSLHRSSGRSRSQHADAPLKLTIASARLILVPHALADESQMARIQGRSRSSRGRGHRLAGYEPIACPKKLAHEEEVIILLLKRPEVCALRVPTDPQSVTPRKPTRPKPGKSEARYPNQIQNPNPRNPEVRG